MSESDVGSGVIRQADPANRDRSEMMVCFRAAGAMYGLSTSCVEPFVQSSLDDSQLLAEFLLVPADGLPTSALNRNQVRGFRTCLLGLAGLASDPFPGRSSRINVRLRGTL